MRPTTLRLFSVASLICVVSVVGFVLDYNFQWPSEFVTTEVTEHNVTPADIGSGTVSFIPLAPWIALVGPLAMVVLCLLGVLLTIGELGEVFTPPTPYVPRAVLIAAGVASTARRRWRRANLVRRRCGASRGASQMPTSRA